jgi:hypothetical protein
MGEFNPTLGRDSLPSIITPVEQAAREFVKDIDFLKVKGIVIDKDSVDAGNTNQTYILRPGLALIRGAGTGGKFVPADHASAPISSAILEAVLLNKYVNMHDPSGATENKEAQGMWAGRVDDSLVIYVDGSFKTAIQAALLSIRFE